MLFFFKQKTAYEMRISDWSSVVCSSVLQVLLRCPVALAEFAATDVLEEVDDGALGQPLEVIRGRRAPPGGDVDLELATEMIDETAGGIFHGQIGRASCRERVCKNV